MLSEFVNVMLGEFVNVMLMNLELKNSKMHHHIFHRKRKQQTSWISFHFKINKVHSLKPVYQTITKFPSKIQKQQNLMYFHHDMQLEFHAYNYTSKNPDLQQSILQNPSLNIPKSQDLISFRATNLDK